ncbi:MAG: DinB family protein [Gemmataceae bacterium]|nr:DinB family protein [Gemmataceae bacterium]
MPTESMIEDLYRANDWAHEKLFRLCDGLSDEQLDTKRELGMGSLRATLFHVLAAEEIWYDRWTAAPARPFPLDPSGMSLAEIEERLKSVAAKRRELIDRERANGWSRMVQYKDLRGNEHSRALDGLLLHVANHGVHHRAQTLNYLKGYGRHAVVGLDYLFYKLARPSVPQDADAIETRRKQGLEIAVGPGVEPIWDRATMVRYFGYHDWAIGKILDFASALPDEALDRDFSMGHGSIRKTLTHLHDVEPFWLANWTGTAAGFVRTPEGTPIAKLRESWATTAAKRNAFVANLDAAGASNVVAVSFGGPAMKFRVVESMLQICVHGTHHRAQVINMLRHSGVSLPQFDVPVWLKEIGQ